MKTKRDPRHHPSLRQLGLSSFAAASLGLLAACVAPEVPTTDRTAAPNERVAIQIPDDAGAITVTLDGRAITPVARMPERIFLDLVAAPEAEAVTVEVKAGRRTLSRDVFALEPFSYASSAFVVIADNIGEAELVERLAGAGLSIVPDSLFAPESGRAVVLVDIGAQTTDTALQELSAVGAPSRLGVDQNLLRGCYEL